MRPSIPVALVLACAACPGGGGNSTDSTSTDPGTGTTGTSPGTTAPDPTDTAPTTTTSTTASTSTTTPGTTTAPGTTTDPTTSTTSPGTTTGGACDWGDGSCTPGTLLFCEHFDDDEFAGRGWYDGPSGTIDADNPHSGPGAFACHFAPGASSCTGGKPARHPVPETQSVWLSYWVRYSDNWVGSGKPYHPHEFHFVTNADDDYVGPANSHLTTYIEDVGGVPRLAIQDARNVDPDCILLNNDNFIGCDGDFDTYPFTEMRSAAACNGILGALDGRDCFDNGNGSWYSARYWDSPIQAFGDAAPYDKTGWHRVEAYFQLNSIEGGVGVVDGQIKYWLDGELLIDHDDVFLRTGVHADMAFDQFLMLPYIGDGSPVDQTFWVDDLRVATAPTDAPCP